MGIFDKLFKRKNDSSSQKEETDLGNNNPIINDDIWDSSLEIVKPNEEIWYHIYDKLKTFPHGGQLGLEQVFEMPCSPDEYMEFLKFCTWKSGPHSFETDEDFEKSLQNPEDNVGTYKRLAYWYLFKQDFAEANKWFAKAAEKDDSEATTRLAGAYTFGYGIERDVQKGLNLYKKVIQIDAYPDALMDLALNYTHGKVLPKNKERAFFLMERAAKQGLPAAQFNLGIMYRTGDGVSADMQKALYWYHLSAEQGYEQAIMDLFNFYMSAQNYEYADRMLLLGIHFDIEQCKNIRNELIRLSNQAQNN